MVLKPDTIEKIKALVRGFSEKEQNDLQYLYDEYGINLFVDCQTDEMLRLYNDAAAAKIRAVPENALIIQNLSDDDEQKILQDFISNKMMLEHTRGKNIVKRLHPIVKQRILNYSFLRSDDLKGMAVEILPLAQLYKMNTQDPKSLDSYFQEFELKNQNGLVKEAEAFQKHLAAVKKTFLNYHTNPNSFFYLYDNPDDLYYLINLLESTLKEYNEIHKT